LQAAGYRTAIIGKWHLESTPTGFDYYSYHIGQGTYYNPDFIEPDGTHRYEGYATDLTVENSLKWLSGREKDKPFCLMMHFKAPHRNWLPAPGKMDMYEDTTFPVPENFWDDYAGRQAAAEQKMSIDKDLEVGWDLKVADGSDGWGRAEKGELARMTAAQRAAFDKVYVPLSDQFNKAALSGRELVEYKYQRYLRDYMKVISSVDDAVGRMLDYLKAQGLDKNTIVIYTSDQGFYLGEHGWFDKRFMYEESFRTPMLVRYPGRIPAGRKSAALVQNIDIAPTLLDYAGIAVPADIQGESMRPVLSGEAKAIRPSLYYHYYEFPQPHAVKRHYGVRTDSYKLIHFYYDIDKWELYDLKKDPHEMRNVIDDPAYMKVVVSLMAEIDRLQVKYEDTNPTGDYDGWAK
jgi:arylsulfatase A-like enzyme